MPDVDAYIVVHSRENRRKCSVEGLRVRPGLRFLEFAPLPGFGVRIDPEIDDAAMRRCLRLGFGGPLLSAEDRARPLLVLDATWRHVRAMEAHFADAELRSLPALTTAYPRVSKSHVDPPAGLATIEALFAAFVLTGRPVDGLLDDYRWKDRFLDANRAALNWR